MNHERLVSTDGLLACAPERVLVDRLAQFFESSDTGEPLPELVDLDGVIADVPPEIAHFYRHPDHYAIRACARAGIWSRYIIGAFATAFRQCCIPVEGPEAEDYEVFQRLYRDREDRPHWDRYVHVRGELQRLFTARIDLHARGLNETFVLWGLPARLAFDARAEASSLVLTLNRSRSSPIAWPLRVRYRTTVCGEGTLRTEGDFRMPMMGLHVRTRFSIAKRGASTSPGA